ncbi:hypothetical protein [Psychromarinibacter sp. S121]|uniref:hypothetical protein n=1 Tax=Psychromarinibacter sp. S121 TaxID=3415127 RepID=UPI003C7CB267
MTETKTTASAALSSFSEGLVRRLKVGSARLFAPVALLNSRIFARISGRAAKASRKQVVLRLNTVSLPPHSGADLHPYSKTRGRAFAPAYIRGELK